MIGSPFYTSSNTFRQRKCVVFVISFCNYPGEPYVAVATRPCTYLSLHYALPLFKGQEIIKDYNVYNLITYIHTCIHTHILTYFYLLTYCTLNSALCPLRYLVQPRVRDVHCFAFCQLIVCLFVYLTCSYLFCYIENGFRSDGNSF